MPRQASSGRSSELDRNSTSRSEFAEDLLSRRQAQVESTVQRTLARLSALPRIPHAKQPIDPHHAALLSARGAMRKMEGKYGSAAVMLEVAWLWLGLFVLTMGAIWLSLIVLPFLMPGEDVISRQSTTDVINLVQIYGVHKIGALYSYYPKTSTADWKFDLAFPLILLSTYLYALLMLIRFSMKRFPLFHVDNGNELASILSFQKRKEAANQIALFSKAAFSSWDFKLTSIETSRQYRRGLRQKFQNLLQDLTIERTQVRARSFASIKVKSLVRFFSGTMVWPGITVAAGFAAFEIMAHMEEFEDTFGFKYAQTLAIWLLTKVAGATNRALFHFERWAPGDRITFGLGYFEMKLLRQFLTRIGIFGCLVYYIFNDVKYHNNDVLYCKEQAFGEFWYRLALTYFVCEGILCNVYIYILRMMGKPIPLPFEEALVEIAHLLGLFLCGVFLSPLLGFIIALHALLQYAFNKKALIGKGFYKAPDYRLAYMSPCRTSWLVRFVLVITVILSSFPQVFFMYVKHANCGPHGGLSVVDVFSQWLEDAPKPVTTIWRWTVHPVTLLSGLVLCVSVLIVLKRRLNKANSQQDEILRVGPDAVAIGRALSMPERSQRSERNGDAHHALNKQNSI